MGGETPGGVRPYTQSARRPPFRTIGNGPFRVDTLLQIGYSPKTDL
jgi:hypothetical protein